jgi:hypothetical protein
LSTLAKKEGKNTGKKKDKKTSRKFGTYENSAKVFKRLTLASRSGNVDKRTNTIFFRTPAAAAKKRSGREGRPHGGQSIGEEMMSRAARRGPRSQALFSAGSPSVATVFYYIWLAMFSQIAKLKIKVLKMRF